MSLVSGAGGQPEPQSIALPGGLVGAASSSQTTGEGGALASSQPPQGAQPGASFVLTEGMAIPSVVSGRVRATPSLCASAVCLLAVYRTWVQKIWI